GSSDNKSDGGSGTAGGGGGGGSGGSGGGVALRFRNTFDTDKQGWTLSDYVDANYFNSGATPNPDTGGGLAGGGATAPDFTRSDGGLQQRRRRPEPRLAAGHGDVHGLQAVRRSAGERVDADRPDEPDRARADPPEVGDVPGGRHSVPHLERPDRRERLRLRRR